MCGICGFVSTSTRSRPGSSEIVRAMSDAIAHRGPDGEGVWVDDAAGIGFGHRRLAFIDLTSGGLQPMSSASGRHVVTFNGEIYNYRELRGELESAGHSFRSQSDTEVLIEACERWGVEAAVKRLIGIFAFGLWDREERTLYLVRDQLGVKPLYWGEIDGTLLFGSELKALIAHPQWRAEIDRDALTAYFRHNYVPAPHTIYRGVFKLPPGSVLTLRRGAAPSITAYWDAWSVAREGFDTPFDLPESVVVDQLEAVLKNAVKSQMVADVPIGAFLSGGIDSSTVVALMQAQSEHPVRTFTIGFREGDYDEAGHARAVAHHLGTEHTELFVSPDDARDLIPSIADWFDEPFGDSSQLPTFLVAQMTRRHVTVALSGDGGDEVFAGYDRYLHADRLWRHIRPIPRALRRGAARMLRAVPATVWDRLSAPLPRSLRSRPLGDMLHKIAAIIGLNDEDAIYRFLMSQWKDPENLVLGGHEPRGILGDASVARGIPDFISRMQALDAVTYLPDDILAKVDRTSMAVALEARVPLLDPRVVAFAWRLPPPLRIRHGKGKWLLRQVLHRYVPDALVERPKMGFGMPIGIWLRGPLRDWAEDLLNEERLRADGLLDPKPVRQKWHEHLSGRRDWQYALWGVLMFQEWKRRWSDGRSVSTIRAA